MYNLTSVCRGLTKYANDQGTYDSNESPAENYDKRSRSETKKNTNEVLNSPTSPLNVGVEKPPQPIDNSRPYEGDTWKGYLSAIRNNPSKFWGGFNGTDAAWGGGSALAATMLTSGMKSPGLRLLYSLLAGFGGAGLSRISRELYAANNDKNLAGMTLPGKLQARLTGTQVNS